VNKKICYVHFNECYDLKKVDSSKLAKKICDSFENYNFVEIEDEKAISSIEEFQGVIKQEQDEYDIRQKQYDIKHKPLYKVDVWSIDTKTHFHNLYIRMSNISTSIYTALHSEIIEKANLSTPVRVEDFFYIKSIERIAEPGEKTEFDKV